jgi:hypothetical protein
MINAIRQNRTLLLWTGFILLIGGGALVYFVSPRFESLPNYKRIALLVPLTLSLPLLHVDSYLNWNTIGVVEKWRAATAPFWPVLLTLGAVAWFFSDPTARA